MKVKRREIRSEQDLKATLDEMYRLSKDGNEPFYDLIELMMNRETIITAIHNIKSNKGSTTKGIDNKDINHYLQMNEKELISLVRNSIRDYDPKPVLRVFIPKANSDKMRPLGIPTILDRIIQEVARIVLDPIAEGKFYEYSFGFRPFRAASHACAKILDRLTGSHTRIAIEGDIKSFFDHINHNKLIEILWNMGVKDKRFLMLIKKMLKAGVMEDGKHTTSEMGTPQGGIISPLLANIYLNGLDWLIARMYHHHPARYKDGKDMTTRRVGQRHQKCFIIRYADDWVILCEDRAQAETILTKVRKYLSHVLHLELSAEKTVITDLTKQRMRFLGFEFFVQRQFRKSTDKLVGKFIPRMDKLNEKVRTILKEIRKLRAIRGPFINATEIELINSKIVGLAEYYKYSNCSHIFKAQDQKIYNQALKTWYRLNGKKGTWEDLTIPASVVNNRLNRHNRRNDRIFFVEVDNVKVGLTKFQFTPSANALRYGGKMNPYPRGAAPVR